MFKINFQVLCGIMLLKSQFQIHIQSNIFSGNSSLLKTNNMKNLCFSLLFIILWSSPGFSQEFTGRVLDLKTKNPVAYATIQYAKNRGVVTNEEGYFSINLPASNLDNLLVSSMGFETQEFKSSQLENNIIYLKSKVIQLGDIFLSNKKLTGEEILERAKSRVAENYNFNLRKKRFFFRESNVSKVNKFLLDIDESTIPDINQELMDSISESIPKYSDSYKEVLGDFYGDYSQQKIEIIKAANLFNPQSKTSLNKLTNRLDDIFKENVKKNSYLKIKSGLFGVKVDAEEIAEERKENVKEEKEKKKPTPEELANSENDRRKEMVNSTNENISSILKNTFWKEDGIFDLFDKLNRYKYEVEEYTYFDNEIVYVIAFEPKGRSEFRGRVYVNTSDFGVHRIDYTNVKPLKKFRLLGISAIDDVYQGKMIFSKDENGKYVPRYFEQESGQSIGVDRPLTVIEKNKNVMGKRKQNELDMDILINISQLEKCQFVVYGSQELDDEITDETGSSQEFDFRTFKRYDPDFWKGYNIIEPNAAIREFTALQAD